MLDEVHGALQFWRLPRGWTSQVVIPTRSRSFKIFFFSTERAPVAGARELRAVREVLQEWLEIVKMFEARQQRTNKISSVRYSLGDSGRIVFSPEVEGLSTFRERQLSEEYWIAGFVEVFFESAFEISDCLKLSSALLTRRVLENSQFCQAC